LNGYSSLKDLRLGIRSYINFHNSGRYYQSLDYNVPNDIFYSDPATRWVKKRVGIPNFSWLNSPNSLEKLSFEKCIHLKTILVKRGTLKQLKIGLDFSTNLK
ncbi:hypothetical protein MJH12_02165, partial [bacterium]|nr:hypothetical protein [bacterium]